MDASLWEQMIAGLTWVDFACAWFGAFGLGVVVGHKLPRVCWRCERLNQLLFDLTVGVGIQDMIKRLQDASKTRIP